MAYSGSFHSERPERAGNALPAASPAPPAVQPPQPPQNAAGGRGTGENMPFNLNGILKKIEAAGMETDDLLMALILYLMYRESGDKDLLIMLAAMLLT